MDILIIGGCGYIGSVLTEVLLNENHNVTVVDNLRYKQKPLLHLFHRRTCDFHVLDCRDINTLQPFLSKSDCVIQLAAIVGAEACDRDPFDAETTNLVAVEKICKNLSKEQLLLYPCTNSGYGIGQSGIYCTEESALNPISLYGKTKVAAEKIVMSREKSISFRLATVFGASLCMRNELLVNDFVLRAIRDRVIVLFESHFKRNYVHVRDVCNAFLLAIKHLETMSGNVYNVGLSSANLSKLELCNKIKKHVDFTILECNDRKDTDQRNYIVSNEKIEQCGFVPEFSIDDGIRELQKCYRMSDQSYYN